MSTVLTLNLAGQGPMLEHGLNAAYKLGIKAAKESKLDNILLNHGTLMQVHQEAKKIKQEDPNYRSLSWLERRFYDSGLYQTLGLDL